MNQSVSEEESQESTENEDTEPKSNVYLKNEINQYDDLLKDNEIYRQRMKNYQDLQSDIVNWLKIQNNASVNNYKSINEDEGSFPKVQSLSEIELSSFSIDIRPYHKDAIFNVFNCP